MKKEALKDNATESRKKELIDKAELKREMIKWVKEWRSHLSEGVWIRIDRGLVFESDAIKKESDKNLIGRIDALVRIFNISDDDLK